MSTNEVKKIAQSYARTLRANGVLFSHMYLFGSQAQNKANRWSDIDILVLADKFPGGYLAFKSKLWSLTRAVDTRIEPHACTTQDFKTADTFVAAEAKQTGIKIV